VRAPLAARLPRFTFHLLARCGHTPWQERQARDAFFRLLRRELENA
jgi:pimeloyl-ACP methyl ester carboxylesterase